jgi:hypothetical protein
MSLPGRKARQTRTAMRSEFSKERAAIDAARRSYYADLFREITQKAGIDFATMEEEARRRRKAEMRKIDQLQKTISRRYEKELRDSRDELRVWLDDYLEKIVPVYRKIQGNPILWTVRPVEVQINYDPTTPGMGGGTRPRHRAFWTSECDYDLGTGYQHHNIFHPYILVDNRDDQHTDTSTWLEIVLRFEIDAPEGDYFLGERIWAPVVGRGSETFFEGYLSCSDKFPVLNRRGCQWDTIRYDIRVDQPSSRYFSSYDLSNPADPDMGYIPMHTRPYCGGLDGGLYMFSTEPIVYSDIGGFMYDFPGILLDGRARDGMPISVEVRLYFSTGVYYEKERHEIDFREPDWLQIPWVMIYGRRIDL